MSRVGKKPIKIPEKAEIGIKDNLITVKGEKGTLSRQIHPLISIDIRDNQIFVQASSENRKIFAMQGLMRSLINNMIIGVTKGFERELKVVGIGYRAELSGNYILFNLGYSHQINYELADGISATVDKNNVIKLFGIDKAVVGRIAASIRQLRPPDAYKGKGIMYSDEKIRTKAGKTGTTTTK